MPRMKDYQIPFGLTGRGMKFEIHSSKEDVRVKIKDSEIVCSHSHYFHNLKVENGKNKFDITFCHKLRDRKKEVYGDIIKSEVKEIKILNKDGEYYLYLPYTINYSEDNFKLQNFFMTASPKSSLAMKDGKCELVTPIKGKKPEVLVFDSINVAGFDLNLSTPITVTNAHWPIKPQQTVSNILCSDTPLSKRIKTLSNTFVKLTDCMRSYKKSVRLNVPLVKEDVDWITAEANVSGSLRYQLQVIMTKLKKKERKIKHECRRNGHNNLSENVRLLELMDASFSLHKCYININAHDRKNCVYALVNDERKNFRDFVSKQFGSIVARHCKATKVNVAFLEDLDFRGDFDNDTNSLSRLFAAGQLKKSIYMALEKVGIGCVFVPYAGTSRTDPVSADFGDRDKLDKTKLYVIRDDVVGKIHSDLAASLNVLLVGLSHSIVPYKFWMNKDGKIKDGKRIKTFLAKRKFEFPKNYSGWVYVTPSGLCTEEQKKAFVARIKHVLLTTTHCQNFDINGSGITTYKAFTVN